MIWHPDTVTRKIYGAHRRLHIHHDFNDDACITIMDDQWLFLGMIIIEGRELFYDDEEIERGTASL